MSIYKGIKKLWNNILFRNVLLSVTTVALLLVASSIFLDSYTRYGKSSLTPDFTGLSLDSVHAIADKYKWRIEIIDSIFEPDLPRGSVLLQNPENGIPIKMNRKIFLTINSRAPRKEAVPNVKEISLRLAKTMLNNREFRVGRLDYSSEHPYTNQVFKQMYHGREIEPGILLPIGEYIDLKVGLNPESDSDSISVLRVPNVAGLTKEIAEDVIIENSLNYTLVFETKGIQTVSDSLRCVAYKQDPPAGTATYYGHTVKIWLKLPNKSKK
jgi:beta-lactam-binding protein with PASTA domain